MLTKFLLTFIFCAIVDHVQGGSQSLSQLKVVIAINAGGDEVTDNAGIKYKRDRNPDGIASDYGMNLMTIGRVFAEDEELYRTERYSYENFGYDIPLKEDGQYVLVLKFCEVYFHQAEKKVFDVLLNKEPIVEELDIFSVVGHGNAHDEIIPFEVIEKGTKVKINSKESKIRNGKIRLEFIKGKLDNPKINAFYVIKGTYEDVPKLMPLDYVPAEEDFEEQDEYEPSTFYQDENNQGRKRVKSGPRSKDPWEDAQGYETWTPVLLALGSSGLVLLYVLKNLSKKFKAQ